MIIIGGHVDVVASGGSGTHKFALYNSFTKAWFLQYKLDLMSSFSMDYIKEVWPAYYYPKITRTQYSVSFESLPADNYTVVTMDENGCANMMEFSILALPEFTFDVSRVAKTCNAQTMGDLTIDAVTSNYGPFTYSLLAEGSGRQLMNRDGLYANVPGGTHVITVYDSMVCFIYFIYLFLFYTNIIFRLARQLVHLP